jgi:Glyoxalase/Bleomycin resistance protein/Dioxygenase superfamily.
MKVIEIAFSCYPVTDLKRAKQFYENTLGLKQTTIWGDDNQAWIEYDIGPSTLAITNYPSEWKPSPDGGGVALEVDSFDAAIAELKKPVRNSESNRWKAQCVTWPSSSTRTATPSASTNENLNRIACAPQFFH